MRRQKKANYNYPALPGNPPECQRKKAHHFLRHWYRPPNSARVLYQTSGGASVTPGLKFLQQYHGRDISAVISLVLRGGQKFSWYFVLEFRQLESFTMGYDSKHFCLSPFLACNGERQILVSNSLAHIRRRYRYECKKIFVFCAFYKWQASDIHEKIARHSFLIHYDDQCRNDALHRPPCAWVRSSWLQLSHHTLYIEIQYLSISAKKYVSYSGISWILLANHMNNTP